LGCFGPEKDRFGVALVCLYALELRSSDRGFIENGAVYIGAVEMRRMHPALLGIRKAM